MKKRKDPESHKSKDLKGGLMKEKNHGKKKKKEINA